MLDNDGGCAGFRRDAVAIVGMACRFPGAGNPREFWRILRAGEDCVTRWQIPGTQPGRTTVAARAVLANVDQFDASFFRFTPKQAAVADPQLRIALECAWEAGENAGYDLERYEGTVGVFMGASLSTYLLCNLMPGFDELLRSVGGTQILLTNDKDFIPTTISHRLNLRGPSQNISTACSTSLVAVHSACRALAMHECDMALAGASSILLPQDRGSYEPGGIYSEDGYLRAFDGRANGTVGGSGCGVVALKRIEDALREGDFIYAVILGGAVNNDGADKVSFTAPSVSGQCAVIEQAWATAGVDAASLGLIEGHGTGTLLGDALELQALTQLFAKEGVPRASCALGSVKTNIGHLDAAAGVAGLIKVALALHHRVIPPNLHFVQPDMQGGLRDSALYVPTTAIPWRSAGTARRAAVSAFGIGGTNAHLVLQEAPTLERAATSRSCYVIPLSAMSEGALSAAVVRLLEHLDAEPDLPLADVAFTLGAGRKAFEFRRAFVCRDARQLRTALESVARSAGEPLRPAVRLPVAFMFSRLDTSAALTLQAVYGIEAPFRRAVSDCARVAGALLGGQAARDLCRAFTGEPPPRDSALCGAIRFTAAYSLARLWMSWGVTPDATAGEDEGLWVAACLAGVVSTLEAMRLATGLTMVTAVPREESRIPLLTPLQQAAGADSHYREPSESLSGGHYFRVDFGCRREAAERLRQATAWPDPVHAGNGLEAFYESCASAWVAGLSVDWGRQFVDERRSRVPLPTYAFDRSCHWIHPPLAPPSREQTQEQPSTASGATASPVEPAVRADVSEWFYVPTWTRDVRFPVRSSGEPRSWLVLSGRGDFCARFIDRIRARGHSVTVVTAGKRLERLDGLHVQIDPARAADYHELLSWLAEAGHVPERIVHLWSLTENDCATPVSELLDEGLATGLHSLLFTAQAIGRANVTQPIRITSVYNGVHDVAGGSTLQPAKAALTAALKIIPHEYPNLSCLGLDVGIPPGQSAAERRLLDRLIDEADAEPGEVLAAYRDDTRWVQQYRPVRLPALRDSRFRLKEGGVYLITGGAGGVGLELAEYLTSNVRCCVALLGRSALPPQQTWRELAASGRHEDGDDLARRVRRLLAMQGNGSRVLYCQANVAEHQAVGRAIAEIERSFGALNGVIHAAAVADTFGVIQGRSKEMTEQSMAAKLRGAVVLNELLRGRQLDFFVLCSAIGSVLHALKLGEVGYVAANDFVDCFASYRSAREHGLTVAINWTDWRDVGMSARAMQRYDRERKRDAREPGRRPHPLLGRRGAAAAADVVNFTGALRPEDCWVLDGHRLSGVPVMPGTGYLELALAAFVDVTGAQAAEITDVGLTAPLAVPDGDSRELRVTLRKELAFFSFSIESRSSYGRHWQLHASGRVRAMHTREHADALDRTVRTDGWVSAAHELKPDGHAISKADMQFGGRWNCVRAVAFVEGQGTAELSLPQQYAADLDECLLHPAVLDCAFSFLIPSLLVHASRPYVPLHYRSVRVHRHGRLPNRLFAHARGEPARVAAGGSLTLDVAVVDETGEVWVELTGMTARESGSRQGGGSCVLDMEAVGQLRTLRFVPRQPPELGAAEVEVEIDTAALNFKDVLIALGMTPAPPGGKGKFGMECAGRVVRVGAEVRELAVGDEVMGFGGVWVAPRAIFPATWLARKAARLSMEQAASVPTVFTVAQLALCEVGGLHRGESVLIHSATGGVGLAAIQIARRAGAQIYATAGSEAKRAYLRSAGIQHVFDSRSPAFLDGIRQVQHRGVDVVLNSLGPALSLASLEALRPQGRFLELGLRNESLAEIAQSQRKYFLPIAIDVTDPALQRAWLEVVRGVSDGTWEALPTRAFGVGELAAAFEYMAAARHVGKVVISYADWPRHAGAAGFTGIGRADRRRTEREYFKQLLPGMAPRDAVDAFDRIIHQDYSRIVVSVEDLFPLLERSDAARRLGINAYLATEDLEVATRSRPETAMPLRAPQNDTQIRLARIWKDLLGLGEIGLDDNFFDLGGDSLMAIRLLSRCREEFEVDQTLASLLDYPTIGQLADRIEELRRALAGRKESGETEHMVV